VEFPNRGSIRFYGGEILGSSVVLDLTIGQIYEILCLAIVKSESFKVASDVKIAKALVAEFFEAVKPIIYAQVPTNIRFFTKSSRKEMLIDTADGGSVRLNPGNFQALLGYCIFSEEQLKAIKDIAYQRIVSYQKLSDFESAQELFAHFHVAFDTRQMAC
jgi:hypothetical protein